jgi:hypothetical protein
MVGFFRMFLVDTLGIAPEDIHLLINVYTNNGMSIDEIERYWLALLELPKAPARGHMLNHMPTSSSGRGKTSFHTALPD